MEQFKELSVLNSVRQTVGNIQEINPRAKFQSPELQQQSVILEEFSESKVSSIPLSTTSEINYQSELKSSKEQNKDINIPIQSAMNISSTSMPVIQPIQAIQPSQSIQARQSVASSIKSPRLVIRPSTTQTQTQPSIQPITQTATQPIQTSQSSQSSSLSSSLEQELFITPENIDRIALPQMPNTSVQRIPLARPTVSVIATSSLPETSAVIKPTETRKIYTEQELYSKGFTNDRLKQIIASYNGRKTGAKAELVARILELQKANQ